MKCQLCEVGATHRKIESTGEVHFYCDQHAPTSASPISGQVSASAKSPVRIYGSLLALGVIIIVIGIAIVVSRVINRTSAPTPTIPMGATTTASVIPVGVSGTANAFFSFVDTFTQNKDVGTPQVIRMVPELDLIAFSYGTSQESVQFGVYNYVTNELNTGVGSSNYVEVQQVVALLSNNRVVLWSSPGVDAGASARPKLLVIDYVTKKVVATVQLPKNAPKYFHEAYHFNPESNTGLLILKNTFDHTDKTQYQTWRLNTETYQVEKTESLG